MRRAGRGVGVRAYGSGRGVYVSFRVWGGQGRPTPLVARQAALRPSGAFAPVM